MVQNLHGGGRNARLMVQHAVQNQQIAPLLGLELDLQLVSTCYKEARMGGFERRVWTELRQLREAEQALQAIYETLQGGGSASARSFMASLRRVDERVRQLESLLERAA